MERMLVTAGPDEVLAGGSGCADAAMERLMRDVESGECLTEVAHDARNMVTALSLFCDLLQEPGVLAESFAHYADELRLVTAASRRLVEKLAVLDVLSAYGQSTPEKGAGMKSRFATGAVGASRYPAALADQVSGLPIANLAGELLDNRNLLAALAGPSIALSVEADGGWRRVWMTGEDLTRVLVNLVKNAAEAMPEGGHIRISVSERDAGLGGTPLLAVAVEDSGPGIPEQMLERVFDRGYTTRSAGADGDRPTAIHGLGLAICRSIVEKAGGKLIATNRDGGGARLEMELPVAGGRGASAARRPGDLEVS